MKKHSIGLFYVEKVKRNHQKSVNIIYPSRIIEIDWNDKKCDWLELEFKDSSREPIPREFTHSLFEDIKKVKKMIDWIKL